MVQARLDRENVQSILEDISKDPKFLAAVDLRGDDLRSAIKNLADLYDGRFASFAPLDPRETLAVTLDLPKVVALCYDRVWWGAGPLPGAIGFGGFHPVEVKTIGLIDLATWNLDFAASASAGTSGPIDMTRRHDGSFERWASGISRVYRESLRVQISPIFSASKEMNAQLPHGSETVAIASVQQIGLADEERLDWAQVVEFRRDRESVRKYRRMVHWIDRDFAGRDMGFVMAEVEQRLEDYESALEKHGIVTVVGALSEILNPKWLSGVTAFGALTSYSSGNPTAGMIAATATTIGRIAIAVAEATLSRQHVANTHREVALVHELRSQVSARSIR